MAERGLTDKQARFVAEYIVDLNARQAAIRAGYSLRGVNNGYRLLKNPTVAVAVDKALAERARRVGINQDMIIEELARLALTGGAAGDNAAAGLKKPATRKERRGPAKAPAKGGGTQPGVKMSDKLKALELLGRHLGMFKDKAEVVVVADLAAMLQAARERAKRAKD